MSHVFDTHALFDDHDRPRTAEIGQELVIELGESDKENKKTKEKGPNLTFLPSLVHANTDANLKYKEMKCTVLPISTFFSNLKH